MNWLEALRGRALEAVGQPEEPETLPVPIAKPAGPPPQIKTVWVQTARPRNGDAGSAEPGFYSVTDDVVTMHDMDGKPIKSRAFGPDDDPHKVAHDMKREALRKEIPESNFNRRLEYQRGSYA